MDRTNVVKAIADLQHAAGIINKTSMQLTAVHMISACETLKKELEISDEECEAYRTSNPTGPLPPL